MTWTKPRSRPVPLLALALAAAVAGAVPGATALPGAAEEAPPAAAPGAGAADFSGLWLGAVVYEEAKKELEIVVELAPAASGALAGTIDLPSFRIEYRPLEEVGVDGRAITFLFRHDSETRGAKAPFLFKGTLGEDGTTIAGTFTEFVGTMPFRLERIGEAFSERPSRETPPVTPMAAGGAELRDAFNRDAGSVRMLLMLSPRCGICLASAQMIQRYVFDRIEGPGLAGYVVWGPMLGDETAEHADTATGFLNDPRVGHFWTPEHTLALALSGQVGMPADEPAWDVFLLYPPEAAWGDKPPDPAVVMHVDRPLPEEQRLDARELHARAAALLDLTEGGDRGDGDDGAGER